MKLKKYSAMAVFVVAWVITGISALSAQDNDLMSLLDRIAERIDSYPANNNMKFMVVQRTTYMDKKWQIEKGAQTIKSITKIIDNEMNDKILEVIETRDGETRDVTQEFIKNWDKMQKAFENKDVDKGLDKNNDIPQAAKKFVKSELEKVREEMKNAEEEGKEKGKDETGYDYWPFTKGNRRKYSYKRLDDSIINGRPVFVIDAEVIKKDKKLYEGEYYIDQETFDVLKFKGKQSKTLFFFLDVIDMEIQYEVLPEGNFVIKNSKTRQSVGMLGMNFGRFIIETENSDYEILPPDNASNGTTEVPDSEGNELHPDATFHD